MPTKYAPLTNEEKEQARAKFNEYIVKYNATFKNAGLKELDIEKEKQKLEERLNNEEMVARYRITQEINAKEDLYKKAFKEASENLEFKEDFLNRSIKFMLKLDDTTEAKEYNKNLLKTYADHPVELTHNRIKNLLNFDPKQLIEIGTDKIKLAEFYRDNRTLCMEANEFGDFFSSKSLGISHELAEAKETIKGMIQNINVASDSTKAPMGLEFFALPELSKDKANLIIINSTNVFGHDNFSKPIQNVLYEQRGDFDNRLNPKALYDQLEKKGMVVDKNIFLKYKVVETNPQTHEQKQVSLYDLLNGKPNVSFVPRTKDEILKLNEVSRAFQDKYKAEFQSRMTDKRHEQFNIDNIETDMKGGFFARIFRKPSSEFKAYMAALRDYNDPKNKNYLNNDNLKTKAEAYIAHVNRSGKPIERMDALRQKRAFMVKDTLKVVEYMEKKDAEIRGEINKSINDVLPKDLVIPKEAAVKEADLEDDLILVEKDHKIDFQIIEEEKSFESA